MRCVRSTIARTCLTALLLASMACTRRDTWVPPEGAWYPEQPLTDTERREESAAKIVRLTRWLRERGHEGVLVSGPGNFAWVTAGGDGRLKDFGSGDQRAQLFFARDGRKFLIAPARESVRVASEELAGIDYEVREASSCDYAAVDKVVGQIVRGKTFATDRDEDSCALEIAALRVPLADTEMRKYRWLGKRCGEVLDGVCRSIQPGVTEHGLQALLSSGLVKQAITPVQIRVAADDRATKYGAAPASGKTKIERMALVGVTASRWGLTICLTRQVHFGRPDERTRSASRAVSALTAGFWARTLPGTTANALFTAALQDAERVGLPARAVFYGGAVGYGLDWLARSGSKEVVQSAQAFAWGAFASPAAAEDTILVVGDQLEVLTEIRGWPVTESTALGRVYRTPAILVR